MTRRLQKVSKDLRDAVEELDLEIEDQDVLSDLSMNLDRVSTELAKLPEFQNYKNAESEELHVLLSYLERDALAKIALKLYFMSARVSYDGASRAALTRAQTLLGKLVSGLNRLVNPSPRKKKSHAAN